MKQLNRIVPLVLLLFLAMPAPGSSQDQRVEINPFFGYSLGDGVTVNPIVIGGEIYDAVNAKDGFAYGFHVGVFATENAEVGFLWSRQESKLEGEGTATRSSPTCPSTTTTAYSRTTSAIPTRKRAPSSSAGSA